MTARRACKWMKEKAVRILGTFSRETVFHVLSLGIIETSNKIYSIKKYRNIKSTKAFAFFIIRKVRLKKKIGKNGAESQLKIKNEL